MSRRTDRVNELLRREISSVLQRDFEWNGLLVTVNSVEVAQDCSTISGKIMARLRARLIT